LACAEINGQGQASGALKWTGAQLTFVRNAARTPLPCGLAARTIPRLCRNAAYYRQRKARSKKA
jgi:hypothetical protein